MTLTVNAPAKINFLLKVVGERADGYHEIRSLFQKIDLYDTLTFHETDSEDLKFSCNSDLVPNDGDNIVMKAALRLREQAGVCKGAIIELDKAIPVAAGLGGGSSDAAATLLALNDMWGVGLNLEELSSIGVGIGADVPFFLGGPLAYVEGIGEKVTPLDPKKSLPLLLVKPAFGIFSGDAYKESTFGFGPYKPDEKMLADIQSGEPNLVAKWLENDLEPWALSKYLELATMKKVIEESAPKPLGVLMSGSGPTLLAIYENEKASMGARKQFSDGSLFVQTAKTIV